jgi:hypothetical protein
MTRASIKEAILSRYHLGGADVQPILGDAAAVLWDQFVHTADTNAACRELEYRIEAGSTRKPNKEGQVARMNEAIQVMLQPLLTYAQATGDLGPLNNLLADWAKSRDLDPARYQLAQAPPPPVQEQTPQGEPVPGLPD